MKANKNISRQKSILNANRPIPEMFTASHSEGVYNPRKHKKNGMKVGLEMDHSGIKNQDPIIALEQAKMHGFDGVYYRLMLDLSPTLDPGRLKEIKDHADSLGLYLEAGVGWVNPYNTSENPEIRRFGGGDYKLAMERMILAAAKIGCRELWAVDAHSIHGVPYFIAYDRVRTDVPWKDQLLAMKKFILELRPLLKNVGCRLNMETHGDATSFELLKLIDEVGEDVLGITLDAADIPLSAEIPMDAIRRLAQYVHTTHCKDWIVYRTKKGLYQQVRPLGQGIINWKEALLTLGKYSPNLHLNLEYFKNETLLPFNDPQWRLHFPDLTDEDIAEFERLAEVSENKIKNGEIMGVEEFNKLPLSGVDKMNLFKDGAAYFRKVINENNL